MTIQRRRAFHLSGASWLLLCAMGNGAAAQDAAPPATQLPEITVTAPSPIQRRNYYPVRERRRASRALFPPPIASRRRQRNRCPSPPRHNRACCQS